MNRFLKVFHLLKAESSAGSSKMPQHLSNSPSSNNLPETLALETDKSNHGKLPTSSADDRELDALLRYINGTDLDQESEAHLHQDHQHGCSGNCRKPVNGTSRISSTKAANKKQRKKAKKAVNDEKNLDKKEVRQLFKTVYWFETLKLILSKFCRVSRHQ